MKTINVSEATDIQLNWLVAKCEAAQNGKSYVPTRKGKLFIKSPMNPVGRMQAFTPTTDPAQMWPIIERERISTRYWDNVALIHAYAPETDEMEEGATGLIAAARAYIVVKLGDVVEVPKELG
jgi:hypothetical protein